MSEWELYWITRLDDINFVFGLFGVITTLIFVGMIVVTLLIYAECVEEGRVVRNITIGIGIFAVSILMTGALIPTTKEYLTIKGMAYVTQSEKVITTGDKLFEAMDGYLDEKLKETKGE